MHTDEILKQINDLQGMHEFKAFCTRLTTAAATAETLRLGHVPLPNLIFAAAPGCGVTLHIRLITLLLKELNLMQFTGEEEYFEWSLANDGEDFDRFLRRVRQAGGFYGQFHGVVGLDVSSMIDDELPPMERLMEYMQARQGKILFALIVPDDTKEHVLQQLLGRFASVSPAELIRMPFPRDEVLGYVTQRLQRRGFIVTDEVGAILSNAVLQLSQEKEFEGYQTLQNLTDEIVWHKISRPTDQPTVISADDVAFILAKDGYSSHMNASAGKPRRRLGFGADTEG